MHWTVGSHIRTSVPTDARLPNLYSGHITSDWRARGLKDDEFVAVDERSAGTAGQVGARVNAEKAGWC